MGENGRATRWQSSSHTLAVKQPHAGSQAATRRQSSSHTVKQPHPAKPTANSQQPHAAKPTANSPQPLSNNQSATQPHSHTLTINQPHSHTATLQQSISHTATQPHSHTLPKHCQNPQPLSKHAHWGVDQEQVVNDEVRCPVGNQHVWPVAPMEDVGKQPHSHTATP
jgi:hypothetical protein